MNEDIKNKVVVYDNGQDGVAVMAPSPFCGLTLQEIIDKDIPPGTPHQIIDKSELPDFTFYDAWEYKH